METTNELLTFLNTLLKLDYNKVEECSNGAAYCQVLDSIYVTTAPSNSAQGNIQMKRVNWVSVQTFNHFQNYKILQASFVKNDIEFSIPVEELVRGSMSSNLQFLRCIYYMYFVKL
jgi:RP/EB family microtubule-associated protein